jgi:hypothetical protein
MVVVSDSNFVASSGFFAVEATKKPVGYQLREHRAPRSARNVSDVGQGDFADLVWRHLKSTRRRPQHGEALGRYLYAAFAQQF